MARLPRLYLPGCAQHITQRGNNREACFYDEADYHWVGEGAGSRGDTKRLKINDSDPIGWMIKVLSLSGVLFLIVNLTLAISLLGCL